MPQVVVMEAADVSAIPKFEEAAAADVEAEAVADVEAEAELEVQETVAAEAEPTTSIEPIDFESIEFGAFEMESPEIVASFEAEGALESAAVEPELEIEAVQEPEVEAVQEPEVEAAKEPEHPEEVEAEVDAAQELEPEPELAVDAEVVREPEVEAVQETEFATEAESTQEPELAAEVDLAEEPELAAEVDLAEEPEFAMEAESVPVADVAIDEGPVEAETAMEYVQVEETVEYAELPEGELLSLEDFLRDAGEQMARLVQDEMAEETVEPGEQSQAMAAPEATGEAQVAEVEGFAEDMESIDFESAFGPMPTLEPVQVGEAVEAPLETETHEAAVSEAAASEVEAFETEAASEAEAFEAAAPETAAVTEAPEPAGSNALATMIAAYSSEDMAAEQTVADDVAVNEDFIALEEPENVEQFAADEFVITDEFRDELLLADERLAAEFAQESEQPAAAEEAVAESIEPQPEAESQPEVESQPEPQLVAAGDEYYGMSLAELEALTAPEAQAPTAVETDGFADLPSIAEVPAWAGAGEASETTETAEATETAESVAEALAEPAVEPQVESPVVEVEMLEMPEIVDAPELTEVTDLSELVDAGESADVEIQSTEEAVAEDVVVEEPVAEQAVVEEPIAEQIAAEEIYFDDDHDEEPAEAAAAPVESAEADEVVHVARPNVPMAQDPADPDSDLDLTDLDTELLDLFLEESNDILDHSDGMLARLREQVEDRDAITNLQRDLHTLKGGARMAGIYAVGELGHAMESLLESVAEGRQDLDATGVVVLERGFDRLHGMVARIGQRKAIALPAGLIAQVEALAEGRALDTAEAGEIIERAATAPKRTAAEAPLNPLSAPMDELGAEDEMTGVRAPQEQVRIRADLLDRLVNYAGEVAIYRARLEQQLGAFRSNLGELNQTTTRLREQLRRLDIETEAQIIARYQREGEANDERFDPLELDRFTNQQQLTRALNESANDLVNLQGVLDELTRQYETLLLQQSRVSSDLQEGLMRTRMVPFDALVPRLRRVLRQAATDTGKQVQLKVDGASGEMDRNVLERMTAPLEHMLRNAMAHGLELPAERRKARKPEEGTVRIAVQREGSEVVLKVSDDGYGLDKQAIREKALERGLIKPDVELSDEALYGMILESGFSTAQTISRLSGRGVGMDVVYSEIRQLGGTLQIRSEQGKGSEFVIRLPFTLAVTQAVFVKIGDTSFAVPIASVQGVGRIARADLDKQLATDNPVFNYAGEDYAIHDLGLLIGHAPAKAQDSLQMPLLLARSGDLRTAISIDQVLGSREIVVKPVGPQVNSVPGIFGATIMGDGRVVVILDVAPLVRRQSAIVREVAPVAPAAPAVAARRVPVVMVVDDSITMRKVTGRVLERNNMEVMTAKDGVDAVEKMAERVPDLVLLDIEMPRMDGYEVAQNMKSDPRLKDVPIIMITSRTGEKHRQRAMDIGVDRYLGKPYQEPELMRNVFDMLGVEAVNG
jgi:chemosensory pili system protein ChpA (sensor histidine kinase/response regulator)